MHIRFVSDSPLLVSYPHFFQADAEYSKDLIGMRPNAEKHESEFLIEPVRKCLMFSKELKVTIYYFLRLLQKTGTILSGSRKFQFNVKLRPLDNVELFRNTSFMIFPVFITERVRKIENDYLVVYLKII